MSFFTTRHYIMNFMEVVQHIAKDKAVKGMILVAMRDIFITKSCKDKGHTEYKFASEGDEVTVIGEDLDNPGGGCRVLNSDNYDEVDTVPYDDLEDPFGE